jgi:hypothetical protein
LKFETLERLPQQQDLNLGRFLTTVVKERIKVGKCTSLTRLLGDKFGEEVRGNSPQVITQGT